MGAFILVAAVGFEPCGLRSRFTFSGFVEEIYTGGCGGIRTHDRRIKSPMLYQLSYATIQRREHKGLRG